MKLLQPYPNFLGSGSDTTDFRIESAKLAKVPVSVSKDDFLTRFL